MSRQIKTIEQLKELSEEGLDCHILLNGGLKSSKHIWYDKECNVFEVINLIDDSEQRLTQEELFTQSNIGKAMVLGSLIREMNQAELDLDRLITDLSNDLKPEVKKIEAMPETTQNHYGFYAAVIGGAKSQLEANIICLALMKAGANKEGVRNAKKLLYS